MNSRRFYFIIIVITSLFLFISGSLILNYIGKMEASSDLNAYDSNNLFNSFLKPFVIGKDPVNFLLLVGDKGGYRTDTMMLVNFNPSTAKLSILSVPRDTRVAVKGMSIPKINGIYAMKNGEKILIDTLGSMLDVKIKYYVYLNISTVRKVVDLLGGVDINVPCNMDYDDPTQNLHIHLKKGRQHLNGIKAEQFLRFRHPNGEYQDWPKDVRKYFDGSDINRIGTQQYFVTEVIKQKANIFYLSKLNDIVKVVYENLETNITLSEVFKLVKSVTGFNPDNLQTFILQGMAKTISGNSYFIYDKTATKDIIKDYFQASSGVDDYSNINEDNTGTSTHNEAADMHNNNSSITDSKVKKDVTENNPSNNESSINGSTVPEP